MKIASGLFVMIVLVAMSVAIPLDDNKDIKKTLLTHLEPQNDLTDEIPLNVVRKARSFGLLGLGKIVSFGYPSYGRYYGPSYYSSPYYGGGYGGGYSSYYNQGYGYWG